MSVSPATSHTVLPMEDIQESESAIVVTPPVDEHQHTQTSMLKKLRQGSMPVLSSMFRTSSAASARFFTNRAHRAMTNRQRAEIQLEAILNDPDVSLPAFSNRASDALGNENMPLANAAKTLNTQSFILERIVKSIYRADKKDLNAREIQKLTRVLNGTIDVRALVFFMMLSENDDQHITNTEVKQFYETYLTGLKSFDQERVQEIVQALIQKFHLDEKSQIDFDEFYSIVCKDATLLESLSQFTIHPTWFDPPKAGPKQSKFQRFLANICWQQNIYEQERNKLTRDYIRDNLSRLIWLLLYILVNLALTLYVIIFRSKITRSHAFVVFARIGGLLLNFNSAFIIVLMLKRTILLIRTNKTLRKLIPIDDHIDFHRVVGRVIFGLAILHAIAHMANFGRLTRLSSEYSWGEYMFTTRPNIGWVGGFAPLSGVILLVLLVIMVICSMEWIRRGGHFQIFYWTHLLYLLYFIFLIIHAKNFWHWIVGPLSLFLIEKVFSILTRYSSRSGRTYLLSVTIEQSNVISLNIHRPKNFTFKPGDYITINIPAVALYEFHPFTLSSAPENTNYLTVHIQAVGNWTKRVYQRFKDMTHEEAEANNLKVYRADLRVPTEETTETPQTDTDSDDENGSDLSRSRTRNAKRELVVVNGPYSSCARYIFDCKHVVLIGGGIGITPYASILSSLMEQFRASRTICKNCNTINYHRRGLVENRRLKKVDFIWVNRDQKNFEWFLNLLRQFEQEQEHYLNSNSDEKRFLDIHLYFTEIRHDENIGHVPLDLISKVWAQIAGKDIFTSLKSKTHVGRPKWDEIFEELVSGDNKSTANDVNVFFCGPTTMGEAIRRHCQTYRFRFYEEKF